MATIFITSNTPAGAIYGRFPLQRDKGGPFVMLHGGATGVKVYLSPELIKSGKAVNADFLYERPVQYAQPGNN